jgi:hypothetical protein
MTQLAKLISNNNNNNFGLVILIICVINFVQFEINLLTIKIDAFYVEDRT